MANRMKAILVNEEQKMYIGTWERPVCGPGELLVRVHATAVNRADLLQKRGKYEVPKGASPILGLEMSGVIEEVGEGVKNWEAGNHVASLLNGGGYAEYVVIPEDMAIAIPDQITLTEAAAVPEVFLTAYLNMIQLGKLKAGERILIHAAASGVGTAAIQIAKAVGAYVIATAGTDEKCEVVSRLGADAVINYQNQSFREEVLRRTKGEGVQLIMDPVGPAYWQDNMDVLSVDGRIILFGALSGSKVEQLDIMPAMIKRIHIIASTLRGLPHKRKVELTRSFVQWAMPLFKSEAIQPVIDSVWDAEEANEAHKRMEANLNIGKMIILMH
ncbi:NAD(P)H-quinone oxidoreductase [Paenibacillus marinisediminis]